MNYMNKETGEILDRSGMLRQFKEDYDGGDETNSLYWYEYYDEVYEGKSVCLITSEEADRLMEIKRPDGLFYQQLDTYLFLGIYVVNGNVFVEEFTSKEECLDWLVGSKDEDEADDRVEVQDD